MTKSISNKNLNRHLLLDDNNNNSGAAAEAVDALYDMSLAEEDEYLASPSASMANKSLSRHGSASYYEAPTRTRAATSTSDDYTDNYDVTSL